MTNSIIDIDGSMLEGGGQILRIALSLSVLTKKPVSIRNIRAGREKGGLLEQHLKGLELLRDICNAKVKSAVIGSTEVEFYPGHINGGSYKSLVKTAGSISLVMQIALPCLLYANKETRVFIQGGTNGEMAPQVDYTTEIFKPVLEKFGGTFDFDLVKRGYYPRGGGEVIISVKPIERLNPVNFTQFGKLKIIYGWSFVAGTLPMHLCHTIANTASDMLRHLCKIDITRYKENPDIAKDNGCGIILVAETTTGCYLGTDVLLRRNEKPENTGRRAAEELLEEISAEACVDAHCSDQLIILMALADGVSKIKVKNITLHTKTAIHVTELMTEAKFAISTHGNYSIIQCEGIGLKNILN